MKTIYSIFLTSFCFLFLNSCCTKKDCSITNNYPESYVKFSNFEPYDYINAKYYALDRNNVAIDSTSFRITKSNNTFDFYDRRLPVEELKNISIVFKTNFSNDTIYNIDFLLKESKVKCNTCFLADGRADVIDISNHSFYHKNIKYSGVSTIIISK